MENEQMIQEAIGDRYLIQDLIGRGGMATVYKAIQINLNRPVALKIIHQNLVHDEEFINRFIREAQVCASLNHRNIVTVFDVGTVGQVHFMAMEFLEGMTLRELIRSKGNLNVDETISCTSPIAEALAYIHRRGLVHRDVKSANIFITKDKRPVLMDFGIVMSEGRDTLSNDGSILGTPEYMSPEQAEGIVKPDGRSDLYSLGIILFECLTGKPPFTSDNYLSTLNKVIHDPAPSITSVNPHVPKWLSGTIAMCLEKDRRKRVSDGQMLASALKNKEKIKLIEWKKDEPDTSTSSHETSKYPKYESTQNKSKTGSRKIKLNLTILVFLLVVTAVSAILILTDNFPFRIGIGAKNLSTGSSSGFVPSTYPGLPANLNDTIAIQQYASGQLPKSTFNTYLSSTNDTASINELNAQSAREDSVTVLIREAHLQLYNGAYNRALEKYEKAKRIAPGDTNVLNGITRVKEAHFESFIREGNTFREQHNYSQALVRYNSARSILPGNERITRLIQATEADLRVYQDSMERAVKATDQANNLALSLSELPFSTARVQMSDRSIYMGRTEVTQRLWEEIMGNNPSLFKGANLPVENVSYNDIMQFLDRLNRKYNLSFRLPTEYEWEFAAKFGQPENFRYSGGEMLSEVAWYESNSGQSTHPVSTKRPNNLGIFDMSGNVWEWCVTTNGTQRVLKGGAWMSTNTACSISNRLTMEPSRRDFATGFRLCISEP